MAPWTGTFELTLMGNVNVAVKATFAKKKYQGETDGQTTKDGRQRHG